MTPLIQQDRVGAILLAIEECTLAYELLGDGSGKLLVRLRLLFDLQFAYLCASYVSVDVVQPVAKILLRFSIVAKISHF